MDIIIYLVGAMGFFALVMASIALHEIGHLVPGKLFGVKTTQYFVGFGRRCGRGGSVRPSTASRPIPLGGYVRFVGMYPPAGTGPGQVRAARTGIFQTMADNARSAEWETIRPEDDGRLFYQKKSWQKVIIMAGGPTMNLLLAFVSCSGSPRRTGCTGRQMTINRVQECIVAADASRQELCRQAEDAGRSCRVSSPVTRWWPSTAPGRLLGEMAS